MEGMTDTSPALPPDGVARVEGLLDALTEARRQQSVWQAREVALMAEAVELAQAMDHDAAGPATAADIPIRSLAAQIAAAVRASDRTVQKHMSDAVVLVARFPATFAAWQEGVVSRSHVHVIVEAGTVIDDDPARAAYEAAALEVAQRETPGRLRPAVRLLASRLHPESIDERHARAVTTSDVWVRNLDDGMAELIATLPATIAHGIRDRLDQLARTVVDGRRDAGSGEDATGPGDGTDDDRPREHTPDTRRIGQVRTDVLADLLLTGHASPAVTNGSIPESDAIIAHVQITVPVLTALGRDTTPAELVGKAPIDTATALRLAGAASGWDRVLTHPATGAVLAIDRYHPSQQLKRMLRVRDEHCRFPGCRMHTSRSDIDHTIAREHDGPTELGNLAHLCRRHHTLKHHSAWRVTQTPDGILHWTSPTGLTYPDRPARTLVFTSSVSAGSPPLTPPPPF